MRYILFITVLALLTGCNQKTGEVLPGQTKEVIPIKSFQAPEKTEKTEKTAKIPSLKQLGDACQEFLSNRYDADRAPLVLEMLEIEANETQILTLNVEFAMAALSIEERFTKFKCVEIMKSIFIKD